MSALARHWDIWRRALAADKERRRANRVKFESTEFLPAALEVVEAPPSPVGRGMMLTLIALVLVAFVWSAVGRLDVVISAPGKLIPAERVKIVQSADGGVIRAIAVRDGERVKAGQMLVALDPTDAGADVAQVRRSLETAKVEAARAEALLRYARGGSGAFVAPPGTVPAMIAAQQALVRSQISEFEAQVAELRQRRAEANAMRAGAAQDISRLTDTLPLLTERLERRRELAAKGLTSKLTLLEVQQQQVDHQRSIGIKAEERTRFAATAASIDAQIAGARQAFIKGAAELLAKSQDEIAVREEELLKANRRSTLQRLVAPVAGTVQQLAVHTLGAVVKPADPIMTVVPAGGSLEVDAKVLNRDVGRLRTGQTVKVKLEAYPFTKYGTIPGRLVWLSTDAIQDEDLGLIYQARIRLDRDFILVDGRKVQLGPGLSGTADVRTGSRTILEYLLSPLSRSLQEAGREV